MSPLDDMLELAESKGGIDSSIFRPSSAMTGSEYLGLDIHTRSLFYCFRERARAYSIANINIRTLVSNTSYLSNTTHSFTKRFHNNEGEYNFSK